MMVQKNKKRCSKCKVVNLPGGTHQIQAGYVINGLPKPNYIVIYILMSKDGPGHSVKNHRFLFIIYSHKPCNQPIHLHQYAKIGQALWLQLHSYLDLSVMTKGERGRVEEIEDKERENLLSVLLSLELGGTRRSWLLPRWPMHHVRHLRD